MLKYTMFRERPELEPIFREALTDHFQKAMPPVLHSNDKNVVRAAKERRFAALTRRVERQVRFLLRPMRLLTKNVEQKLGDVSNDRNAKFSRKSRTKVSTTAGKGVHRASSR